MTTVRWLALAARLALLAALAWVFCWPLLDAVDHWGIQDWDQHLFYQAVPRLTVLDYGQLPLWNPYHSGGLPGLGNPQSRFLFPSFGLVLIWGVVYGVKLEIWLHYWIGLIGTYELARRQRASRSGALVAASIYVLGGMLALAVAGGMTTFLCAALIPWATLALLAAKSTPRHAVWCGLALALMFLDGGAHLVPLTFLFLSVYALVDSSLQKRPLLAWLKALTVAAASFVGLAAVKLLPALELLRRFPREVEAYSGYSLRGLLQAWLNPGQRVTEPLLEPEPGWLTGASWGPDENGMYVGALAFSLFLVGVVTRWRRERVLALSFVLLLWLSLGDRVPVSLWQGLRELPLFGSMRVAQRFRYCFMLCFALFAAFGFDHLRASLQSRRVRPGAQIALLGFCLVALIADLTWTSRPALAEAFSLPPPAVNDPGPFRQTRGLPSYDARGWLDGSSWAPRHAWSGLYPAVLQNQGTLPAYEPLADGFDSPVRTVDQRSYRGEVYLDGSVGRAELSHWSPNRLVIDVDASGAGQVVINQNFFHGWSAEDLQVVDHGGLLAVAVTAETRQVTLSYRPRSFTIGLTVTVITLLLLAAHALISRRRRLTAAAPGPSKV